MADRGPWVWGALAVGSVALLAGYGSRPSAPPVDVPTTRPVSATAEGARGRPSLVVALHPKCPCSSATVEELARALAASAGSMDVRVLLVRPPGVPPGWERGALADAAEGLPGALLVVDEGGAEARALGLSTSGSCVAYDAAGRLAFAGGVTAARGHEGDSPGGHAIRDVAAGRVPAVAEAPVFGCPLLRPGAGGAAAANRGRDP